MFMFHLYKVFTMLVNFNLKCLGFMFLGAIAYIVLGSLLKVLLVVSFFYVLTRFVGKLFGGKYVSC